MGRPRLEEIPHVPPTEEERAFRAHVHCSVCQLDWSAAFADRRTGRCVNHLRALHREEKAFRSTRLYAQYGLSHAEIERILAEQGNACAICSEPFKPIVGKKRTRKHPAADHDHVTGHFRAFLCNGCNSGIGFFKDNPEILTAAAVYLRSHKQRIAKLGPLKRPPKGLVMETGLVQKFSPTQVVPTFDFDLDVRPDGTYYAVYDEEENKRTVEILKKTGPILPAEEMERRRKPPPDGPPPGKSWEDAFAAMQARRTHIKDEREPAVATKTDPPKKRRRREP